MECTGRANVMSTWRLEANTLKFLLKFAGSTVHTYDRILPFNKDLTKPQPQLLRYLLTQPYNKELTNHVLSLKKPTKETPTPGVCIPLQKQLVVCLVDLMRLAEEENETLRQNPEVFF